MKIFKILFLVIISIGLVGDASPQTKKRSTIKKNKTKVTKNLNKPMNNKQIEEPQKADVKIIAEGTYSKVEKPFVFIAHSTETYARLQNLIENLPPITDIDFEKNAVVAAFAGTKNTGGYSVDIRNVSGKILLEVIAPPKGAMLTQALTAPYKIALVRLEKGKDLPLEFSANWRNATQIYRVTKGEFESSGGIAGRIEKFDAEGTIGVIGFENYATLIFNLSRKETKNIRNLSATASGILTEGKIELTRLDAGSFSENPKPPLKAFGTLTEDKLSLTFEPLSTRARDGFEVRGKIEAVSIK